MFKFVANQNQGVFGYIYQLIKQKTMHKKTNPHLSNSVHYKKTPLNKGKKCTVKLVHNEHEYNELTDITKCFGAPVKFAKKIFF